MALILVALGALALVVVVGLIRRAVAAARREEAAAAAAEKPARAVDIEVHRSDLDDRIAVLHREATRLKGVDWDGAIHALSEAAVLMRERTGYPAERRTRLPLFLQQAGRYEEAIHEFERLLMEAEIRVPREFAHQGPLCQKRFVHVEKSYIYDKMRLAAERQGDAPMADRCRALTDEHRHEEQRLEPMVEEEKAAKWAAYDAERAARRERRLRKEDAAKSDDSQ
jgi:hypothetical protein